MIDEKGSVRWLLCCMSGMCRYLEPILRPDECYQKFIQERIAKREGNPSKMAALPQLRRT